MEDLNNIDTIAKLAGLKPEPKKDARRDARKDAGLEFMDRLRADHKKQSNEPVFTGD